MFDRLTNAELQAWPDVPSSPALERPRTALPEGYWLGSVGGEIARWRGACERERAARMALEAELEATRELLVVAHRRIATLEGR